ncbi:MAG: substrate-binding domain-containing protein [Treponema sp.]|nr:substrate-binding domain-containing protein [Treponema sp.]
MNRRFCLIFTAFFIFILCGCVDKNKLKEELVVYSTSSFGNNGRMSEIESVKKALSGYKLVVEDAKGDSKEQLRVVEKYLDADVHLFLIDPIDEPIWHELLEKINKKRIPVIFCGNYVGNTKDYLYYCRIGCDFEKSSSLAAEKIQKQIKEINPDIKYLNYAILHDGKNSSSYRLMYSGVLKTMQQKDTNSFVQKKILNGTNSENLQEAVDFCELHPEINLIFAFSEKEAVLAAKALSKEGRTLSKDSFVVCLNASTEGLYKIFENKISLSVVPETYYEKKLMKILNCLEKGLSVEKVNETEWKFF